MTGSIARASGAERAASPRSRCRRRAGPPRSSRAAAMPTAPQGFGAYRPGERSADITGSVPEHRAPAPPPVPAGHWTWDGGAAVTVGRGQSLEMIARKYGVPASAIMQVNGISNPAAIQPGPASGHSALCVGQRCTRVAYACRAACSASPGASCRRRCAGAAAARWRGHPYRRAGRNPDRDRAPPSYVAGGARARQQHRCPIPSSVSATA